MGDYIEEKTTWKRCYTRNSKDNEVLDWNCDNLPRQWSPMDISNIKLFYDTYTRQTLVGNYWVIFNYIDKPSELEKRFNELAEKWKEETVMYSLDRQTINDTFLKIIMLGKDIIPFILKDLQISEEAIRWHIALRALTEQNPISDDEIGKTKIVNEKWIQWGKNNNLI